MAYFLVEEQRTEGWRVGIGKGRICDVRLGGGCLIGGGKACLERVRYFKLHGMENE